MCADRGRADIQGGVAGIGSAQLSFLVEREAFAWWGGTDPLATALRLGLDASPEQVRLVRPEGGVMVTDPLPAAVSPAAPTIAALAGTAPDEGWDCSVRTWRDLAVRLVEEPGPDPAELDRLAASLPVAAHAAVGGDGASVWTARVAVEVAARAVRTSSSDAPEVWRRLRPYQRAGAHWLAERLDAAGGALLADEMGLGKTVQAIAVLAGRPGPHLVVSPASVVGSWGRELARFAPELAAVEHVRGGGPPGPGTVVVATYGQLRADDRLAAVDWDVVVLDEAQQVKNPDTATARRARALSARGRVALTGTPVENRLEDLWALLAFTTPDVLGPRPAFRRRFAALRSRGTAAAAERLAAVVGPHLLRRRKAEVAAELPARLELSHELEPTGEQRRLHRAALDDALGRGLGGGRDRRGRILALLTRLKQICVHPELVGTSHDDLGSRSASFDRLCELLGEITANGEAALVFTQYRQAGELLARHLTRTVGGPVPFLHGGLSRAARERIVADFGVEDGPPVLLLSLRAAGTGLTLTRATHVLHLDRWWNPAVEAQASDRAHRIGQTRTVTVHTFTTRGTVEQLVADLHRGKRDLAAAVLGEGGEDAVGALVRLGDEELRAVLEGAR